DWNGEDHSGNSPHPAPKRERDQDDHRVQSQRAAEDQRSDEVPFEAGEKKVTPREYHGVAEAVETQDRAEGHADDSGKRAEVRNEIEEGDHYAPHDRIAQAEEVDRDSHRHAETDV